MLRLASARTVGVATFINSAVVSANIVGTANRVFIGHLG